MEENEKMAKTIKVLSIVLGVSFVILGVVRAVQGDSLGLGEDGLLGVSVILFGFGSGAILRKKEREEEEEKTGDEGI